MHVPIHYVLVFGAGWTGGEEKEGKKEEEENRHLLVGRPSGGQSPCAWVPFERKDKMQGERVWASTINMKKEVCLDSSFFPFCFVLFLFFPDYCFQNGGFTEADPGLIGSNRR